MARFSKCELHIPFKDWATYSKPDPSLERQNYLAIERWASNFYKNCLPSGGGAATVAYYDTDASETLAVADGFKTVCTVSPTTTQSFLEIHISTMVYSFNDGTTVHEIQYNIDIDTVTEDSGAFQFEAPPGRTAYPLTRTIIANISPGSHTIDLKLGNFGEGPADDIVALSSTLIVKPIAVAG